MSRWVRIFFLLAAGVACLAGVAYVAVSGSSGPPVVAGVGEDAHPAPWPSGFREKAARVKEVEFRFLGAEEVPENIPWVESSAEVGDAAARKGGILRVANAGPFPADLLAFGNPSPQYFHHYFWATVEVPLVREHPSSGKVIPGLAQAWAVVGDQVWFRLNPAARYSNGRPVCAGDFVLGALLRREAGRDGQWEQLRHVVRSVYVYGDGVLAVSLRRKNPAMLLLAARVLQPAEPGFYADFGSDYASRYAWRVPPTTGAYTVGSVDKGRKIALVRVANWWAKDLPGFRYTCNADAVEHHFLADEAQAWEFLMRGKLDVVQTRRVSAWKQYMESGAEPVESGKIVPHRLSLRYPMPPYGIAFNALAVPDPQIRRGLMMAMDMDRAVEVLFQGEAERLRTFTTGFRHIPDPSTPAVHYDPAAARACFALAGYTVAGPDGILRKKDGSRLSVRLTYVPADKTSALVAILAQSAAACGAEIVPEAVPWQVCAAKVQEQSHQLAFWATVVRDPLPEYRRFFHSEARGADAPFGLRNKEMDAAIEDGEAAEDWGELASSVARVDALVHDLSVWLPGWKENHVYLAAWRHVRFPQQAGDAYEVLDAHTYWLDDGDP